MTDQQRAIYLSLIVASRERQLAALDRLRRMEVIKTITSKGAKS